MNDNLTPDYRAVASYLKVVWPKLDVVSIGESRGRLPQENLFELDAKRSLLRQFLVILSGLLAPQ